MWRGCQYSSKKCNHSPNESTVLVVCTTQSEDWWIFLEMKITAISCIFAFFRTSSNRICQSCFLFVNEDLVIAWRNVSGHTTTSFNFIYRQLGWRMAYLVWQALSSAPAWFPHIFKQCHQLQLLAMRTNMIAKRNHIPSKCCYME